MRIYLFGLLLIGLNLLGIPVLRAQTAPGKYWVRFTDKNNSPYSLSRPEEFLSWKCIGRRNRLGLGFDERDIPVNESYITQVLALGPGCFITKANGLMQLPSPRKILFGSMPRGSCPLWPR